MPRRPAQPDAGLPATTFAVLGMLTFGEASGYELHKLIHRTLSHFFFRPAQSQVYSELRRLVRLGFATVQEVEQQLRPDKRLYRITPLGERALRAWLESSGVEPETVRSPFLLKVGFGALMSPETLRADMLEARRVAAEELAVLEELEEEFGEGPDPFFPRLVLSYGLAHNRTTLHWTEEALKQLDKRAGEH